jgi:hypothetical protein
MINLSHIHFESAKIFCVRSSYAFFFVRSLRYTTSYSTQGLGVRIMGLLYYRNVLVLFSEYTNIYWLHIVDTPLHPRVIGPRYKLNLLASFRKDIYWLYIVDLLPHTQFRGLAYASWDYGCSIEAGGWQASSEDSCGSDSYPWVPFVVPSDQKSAE